LIEPILAVVFPMAAEPDNSNDLNSDHQRSDSSQTNIANSVNHNYDDDYDDDEFEMTPHKVSIFSFATKFKD
jgi:hypothetical protein